MTYPATLMTTLAATALTACAAASASGPRFPERLPPHTRVAYAQSYGGIVGGSASVIVTSEGKARVRCRDGGGKKLHRHVSARRWDKVLRRAHLDMVKSDDPDRPLVESPEIWILYKGRVTYLQAFAHHNGYPRRVADVQNAFERFLSNAC
jgi:hypothetical protein